MAKKKRQLELTTTTAVAQKGAATIGATRGGRDHLTRATGAVKVVDTHGRQWNRWSP
jgi:hypothetical protein